MKVLLVNGSSHAEGCTYTALAEVAKTLNENGIETEIFQIGSQAIGGCIGCGGCREAGACVFGGKVAEFTEKARTADGFIFGSPVHYAAASGNITSFLDKAFFSAGAAMRYKPGAAIVSARRAGTTAALEQLNKYFTINQMPVVSSQYWNMVHGNTPEQVAQDGEGMQIMRTLGRNMAWLLHCLEAGKAAGVPMPAQEERVQTNFIR